MQEECAEDNFGFQCLAGSMQIVLCIPALSVSMIVLQSIPQSIRSKNQTGECRVLLTGNWHGSVLCSYMSPHCQRTDPSSCLREVKLQWILSLTAVLACRGQRWRAWNGTGFSRGIQWSSRSSANVVLVRASPILRPDGCCVDGSSSSATDNCKLHKRILELP